MQIQCPLTQFQHLSENAMLLLVSLVFDFGKKESFFALRIGSPARHPVDVEHHRAFGFAEKLLCSVEGPVSLNGSMVSVREIGDSRKRCKQLHTCMSVRPCYCKSDRTGLDCRSDDFILAGKMTRKGQA